MPDDSPPTIKLRPLIWLPWAIIIGVVLALVVIGLLKYAAQPHIPLPAKVTSDVSFPVYYPSTIPEGYYYQPSSYKITDKVLIFALQNQADKIFIAEQSLPNSPMQLDSLKGLQSLSTPAGKAYTGNAAGRPIAILQTNTTLITISGSSKIVPSDVIAQLAQNLHSLPK